ncbi:MAG: hypothetical protein R3259_08985 [Salinimicrobium sediminis]|nr:hypothetical protein [Salinimicrobium sediminis]
MSFQASMHKNQIPNSRNLDQFFRKSTAGKMLFSGRLGYKKEASPEASLF